MLSLYMPRREYPLRRKKECVLPWKPQIGALSSGFCFFIHPVSLFTLYAYVLNILVFDLCKEN